MALSLLWRKYGWENLTTRDLCSIVSVTVSLIDRVFAVTEMLFTDQPEVVAEQTPVNEEGDFSKALVKISDEQSTM